MGSVAVGGGNGIGAAGCWGGMTAAKANIGVVPAAEEMDVSATRWVERPKPLKNFLYQVVGGRVASGRP